MPTKQVCQHCDHFRLKQCEGRLKQCVAYVNFFTNREIAEMLASNQRIRKIKSVAIPWLHGRPVRDTVISKDDILNLKIMLETNSFESFLTKA